MSLTVEQFEELIRRYPKVEAFIVRCELSNEYRTLTYLASKKMVNDWQLKRLEEYDRLQKETGQDILDWNQ